MAWLPDSKRFATGDENGAFIIYDITGKHVNSVGVPGTVDNAVFSPNGKLLLIGSVCIGVRLLRTEHLNPAPLTSVPSQYVSPYGQPPMVWASDSTHFAVSSGGTVVRIYRNDATLLLTLDGCGSKVLSLAWSPDTRLIAAGTSDNLVCLWQVPK